MTKSIALVYMYVERMPLLPTSHDNMVIYLHDHDPSPDQARQGVALTLSDLFDPRGLTVKIVANTFGETVFSGGTFVPLYGGIDTAKWDSQFRHLWIDESQTAAQILANLLKLPIRMFVLDRSESDNNSVVQSSYRAEPELNS